LLARIESDRDERRRVEAALQESEERRRLAQEAAKAGIWGARQEFYAINRFN